MPTKEFDYTRFQEADEPTYATTKQPLMNPYIADNAPAEGSKKAFTSAKHTSSGSNNDYWLLYIKNPKRLTPYTAECEDIIEALDMSFQEGEAFKAIWRKAGQRLGKGKPGNTALRDAEKIAHFGQRMVAIEERNSK